MSRRWFLALAVVAAFGWVPGSASAQVTFFVDNQAGFNAAVAGRPLIGVETFSESTIPPSGAALVNDPLTQGVAQPNFPNGLTQPLTIQSNFNGANPANTGPRGGGGLEIVGTDGDLPGLPPSNVVISTTRADATDYRFNLTPVSAVGFNPVAVFGGGATVTITAFSTANVQLGQLVVPVDGAESHHIGIVTNPGIALGRINVFDPAGGREGADNIELRALPAAVPEPATLATLGLVLVGGGLYRWRRRRVIVDGEDD